MIHIRELEEEALVRFSECPKHLTIVRSADQVEDTPFHCMVDANTRRDFTVPKQEVVLVQDAEYGTFSVIKVRDKRDDAEYALFTDRDRLGFLYPLDKLTFTLCVEEEAGV